MLRQTDGEAISAIVDRIRTRFSGGDDFNRLNYGEWLVHDVKPRINHDSLLLDALAMGTFFDPSPELHLSLTSDPRALSHDGRESDLCYVITEA